MTALAERPSPSRSHGYHRAVRIVSRWAEFYTRDLEQKVAADRRDELASDLWEQGADADARGASGPATELAILWRAARGMSADLSWRRQTAARRRGLGGSELRGWTSRGSFIVATVIASSVLVYALFALGRLAANLTHGLPLPPSATVDSITVAAVLLICGMLLLVRPRTRWLGAIWISVIAPAVLFFGTRAVIDVSATFQWFYDGMIAFGPAEWGFFAGAFLGGIALFYLALAIAWFPSGHSLPPASKSEPTR